MRLISVIIGLACRWIVAIGAAIIRSGLTACCPIGGFIHPGAKTRSWENAERKGPAHGMDVDPLASCPKTQAGEFTVHQAIEAFLQNEEARQLAKTTTCQSRDIVGPTTPVLMRSAVADVFELVDASQAKAIPDIV